MFFDIFEGLCTRRGVTPAQVRKELGISQSTMASWKSRQLTPKAEMLQKLAEYFGVSVDFLLGHTEDERRTIKITTNELIALIKADMEKNPAFIETFNKLASELTPPSDDASSDKKEEFAEIKHLFETINKDEFLSLLEYLRVKVAEQAEMEVKQSGSELTKLTQYTVSQPPQEAAQAPSPPTEGRTLPSQKSRQRGRRAAKNKGGSRKWNC